MMLFIVMYVLWFLFNGKVTVELAIIGALLCGGLCYFTQKWIREENQESVLKGHIIDFMKYFLILLVEIIKANIVVMKLIWNPNMSQWHPTFITFHCNIEDERMRVILANSITLTPGTITVGMEEKEFTVHVLDHRQKDDVENGIFTQELLKIERRQKGNV